MHSASAMTDTTSPPEALLPLTQAIFYSGLSADCLRRYEKDGLLHIRRSANGVRLYSHRDLDQAQQIFASRAARRGLTSLRRNLKPST